MLKLYFGLCQGSVNKPCSMIASVDQSRPLRWAPKVLCNKVRCVVSRRSFGVVVFFNSSHICTMEKKNAVSNKLGYKHRCVILFVMGNMK